MLAIIKRLLVMSGDLRGRVQLSILTSFLDAMAAMLPLGAVFLVLERFAAGGLADAALWRTVLLLLVGATLLRILLKYVTYLLQSTAGFEFVARERVSLGDRLRRVPMGFFYDHSLGDLTATMTNDLNYLENYGMHLLDRVVTGLVSMAAITLCILIFDWRLGLIFILAVLLSFPLYNYMQKRGVEIAAELSRCRRKLWQRRWNLCRASACQIVQHGGEKSRRDQRRLHTQCSRRHSS